MVKYISELMETHNLTQYDIYLRLMVLFPGHGCLMKKWVIPILLRKKYIQYWVKMSISQPQNLRVL